MKKSDLKTAWKQITAGHSFVLACHERPDGDCLGASLALARTLRSMGKMATVLSSDAVPDHYLFLPGSDSIVHSIDDIDFDVAVLVDSELTRRVGDAGKPMEHAPVQVRIDHHPSPDGFGQIKIVNSDVSSTSELVAEIFEANDISIDAETAMLLYTGMAFDTGGFRFQNTSPRTLEIASHLASCGAQPSVIAREIFESRPLRAMKLLGMALGSLQTEENGRIVWGSINYDVYKAIGATDADTEGVVNLVAAVKGPIVAILFREASPGSVRVSLRSRDGFDVNRVARVFDGGGHAAAAGCSVNASLDEAKSRVLAEVRRWMES